MRARLSLNLISVHPVLCEEKQLYECSFRDTEVLLWCCCPGLAGTQHESLGPHQPMKWVSGTDAHYDVTANRAARSSASTATLSALAKVHCLDRRREWTWSCDANNIGSSSALAQGTLVTWITPNNRIKLKPRKTTSDKRHRKSRWTCRSSLQLWWCGHLIRNTLKYPQLWHSGVIIRTHDWN